MKILGKLVSPLIEIEQNSDDVDNRICRLYHSTVYDFLRRNRDVLCASNNEAPCISPRVVAEACLLYLSQPCYSQPLVKRDDDWYDTNDSSVSHHKFLTYSAKYWDKHLDTFQSRPCLDTADISQFLPRVESFLTSNNFQTCLQVQCLWLEAQFGGWYSRGADGQLEGEPFIRRILPDWVGILEQYRWCYYRFWFEWAYFLSYGERDSESLDPFISPCMGQLDRCWWGALGPHNFLSRMKCRYNTYAFEADVSPPPNCAFTTVGAHKGGVRVLSLQ